MTLTVRALINPFRIKRRKLKPFEAECAYCGKVAMFKRESVIACNSNDEDEQHDGYCCQNCGEFGGQLPRIIVCGNPSDSEIATTRKQGE